MRTTTSTSGTTGKTRGASVTTTLAALALALPMSGLFGATAFASTTSAPAASSDHGKATAPGQAKKDDPTSTAAASTTSSSSAASTTTTAAPASNQNTTATPYTNQGGVTTGSNTTKYEVVNGRSGSPAVGGGQPSGNVYSPQPYSTADKNNTGANTTSASNPYASTRNGAPSLNGNGGGRQVGQPCAGCVGKADNKNPPGQAPGGSDHNAGYECDRNHGIGRSNPAHTGCTTPPSISYCPDGTTPMPAGGVKDCPKIPSFCPDGTTPMPAGGVKDCPKPPATSCTENSFFNTQSPPSGATVKVGDTVSVVYSDESPISYGGTPGRNGVTATAPTLTIDGHAVSGLVITPTTGRDKYNVRLSFTVPASLGDGATHTISIKAYDSDQNKLGGDCGVATWTLKVTPSVLTCPNGTPMPANGICGSGGGGGLTCPDGSAMPASGKVADCTHPVLCPSGSTMVNGSCTPAVLCPAGTTMAANGTCTPPVVCPAGTTMAPGNGSCTPPVICPNGAMVGPIVPGTARPGCPIQGGNNGGANNGGANNGGAKPPVKVPTTTPVPTIIGIGTNPQPVLGNTSHPATGLTGGPAGGPGVISARPTALPFTGGNASLLAEGAALLLLVGAGLVVATRRKAAIAP